MGDPIKTNQHEKELYNYDAIVVGSGITGGLAAKELCEKGLKTLVLERGENVEHITGYKTANMLPWEFDHRLRLTNTQLTENPVQSMAGDPGTLPFLPVIKNIPTYRKNPLTGVGGTRLVVNH